MSSTARAASKRNTTYCKPVIWNICNTNFVYSENGGNSGAGSTKYGKIGDKSIAYKTGSLTNDSGYY